MKKALATLLLFVGSYGFAQSTNTPNIGLQVPPIGSNNWGVALNYNFSKLDQLLSGNLPLPGLNVTGGVTLPNLQLTQAQIMAGIGYIPLNPANNLSDVGNAATALANLGGIGASSYKGVWSDTATYSAGQIVLYLGNGYISLVGSNLNNTPLTSPTQWGQLSSSSSVSGTGFVHITSGNQDAAAKSVDLASADVSNILQIANGGNGSSSPGFSSGNANCVITGTWPNQIVTCTGSGGGGTIVDILSGQKDAGTLVYYPGIEYYPATSGVPITIFSASGSGYISNIHFATSDSTAYQSSILSCSVNGESSPSVYGTVRTLFENAWFASGFEANYFTSINGAGFGMTLSMPIPYSNGIICTLTPSASATVWVNVTAHTLASDSWPYTRKLHTSIIDSPTPASVNGVSYTPYSYETLVNYAGSNPGRLVGVWLFDDENAGGTGAALEGNVAVYTDAFNATWKANTAFSLGQIIFDPNGNFQTVTTAGTTGATEPTFVNATVSGNTTTDGTVTWSTSVGTPLNIWRASKPYILGMSFLDPNGNVQTVTTAGTTGATEPTYCATAGCTTASGTVTTTTSLASTMVKAIMVGTGTEDFFGLGFYGNGAGANSQGNGGMNGMTLNATNRRGFYRFFVNDPIRFNNSIGIIRQIGDPSEISLTFNTLQMAATYFYTQDTN